MWIKVEVPAEYMKYIVPKGFIAIDGTSLTICEVQEPTSSIKNGWFTFMLIEHTQNHVIIPMKSINDFVNLEVDVLAKMVEKSMSVFISKYDQRLEAIEKALKISN